MDWPFTVRTEIHVDATVARRPDHMALIYGQQRWTYRQLRAEYDRRAAMLVEAGLQPGDIVATTEPPTDELYLTFLGCCRADVIFFPILPLYTAWEVKNLIARSGAKAVLTQNGTPHPAVPLLPALPLALSGAPGEDAHNEAQRRSRTGSVKSIAYIQTTSGTTGDTPKLACIPHQALTWQQQDQSRWRTWWGHEHYRVYQPSVSIFDRDLCETFGLGGTTVLADGQGFARHEEAMAIHQVNTFVPVPAALRVLTEQDNPPPASLRLQVVRTTAAPLSPALIAKTQQRYGAMVINEYASSEGGAMLAMPREGGPPASVGKPYPGVLARIVNEDGIDLPDGMIGELIIHTPCVMQGYLDAPVATARALRDGWLWTGDLARRNEEGYYFLEGRRALLINVAGFKVAPEEVEAVLEEHPGIREAAVVPMADEARGEAVRAIMVARGSALPAISDLRRFCQERLAGYKIPRHWEFREELPRAALGKVLRRGL